MGAVEIEEAVSRLAELPIDAASFPYAFLEAFGNKPTTIQRLRSGNSNQSDLGGVLQRSNIHLKACTTDQVSATLKALWESPKTASQKARFVLATDGVEFQAESLEGERETLACEFPDFHNHLGFFLPLAGISTVRQIRENAVNIKATVRLNQLYIELLNDNPKWTTAARREDLNRFMARLIFCFFAEDTAIFHSERLFTSTVEQMSARNSSDTHTENSELFRAMDTKLAPRETEKIRTWANVFPYVNGGLSSDSVDVPNFSKISPTYLLHVGNLDWTRINPDNFGSMIQAVADDEERGALGMHRIRVFDPASPSSLPSSSATCSIAATTRPRRVPTARSRQLDHLWQSPAPRWLSVYPLTGKGVKTRADDLFETPLDQAEIDFVSEGGETCICGNPPFPEAREQTKPQKEDLWQSMLGFSGVNSLDYVCGWIWKAVQYVGRIDSAAAFVATNSLCQGQSIPLFLGGEVKRLAQSVGLAVEKLYLLNRVRRPF